VSVKGATIPRGSYNPLIVDNMILRVTCSWSLVTLKVNVSFFTFQQTPKIHWRGTSQFRSKSLRSWVYLLHWRQPTPLLSLSRSYAVSNFQILLKHSESFEASRWPLLVCHGKKAHHRRRSCDWQSLPHLAHTSALHLLLFFEDHKSQQLVKAYCQKHALSCVSLLTDCPDYCPLAIRNEGSLCVLVSPETHKTFALCPQPQLWYLSWTKATL